MKDFLKTTLAVICGTLIVSILGLVITMSILGSLATLGSSTPTLPKEGGVLKIDFEKSKQVVAAIQSGEEVPTFK